MAKFSLSPVKSSGSLPYLRWLGLLRARNLSILAISDPMQGARTVAKFPEIVWEDEDQESSVELGSEDEFASLLEQAPELTDDLRVGAKVQGTIVSVNPSSQDVIVDIGAKGTAVISKEELLEAGQDMTVGAPLQAVVASRRGGDIVLSKTLGKGLQAAEDLQNARDSRIPVKGKVMGENKGGFDVQIFGKKAFCPVSQMDLQFVEDKSIYLGKEFQFLITGMRGIRDITVSRRALLQVQADERLQQILKNLDQENEFDGTVTRLEKFGAFVDIGGIEGLVHISEISHARLQHAEEALQKGAKVRVKILEAKKLDDGKTKLSFSMRALAQDPWDQVQEKYKIGSSYPGRVVSLMNFGAFVALESGVEGLVHISEISWGKRIAHPKEMLSIGDQVIVHVLSIKPESKQMAFSLKDAEQDPWRDAAQEFKAGAVVNGQVTRLKGFGAIIQLKEGVEGLLPVSIMKKASGDSYRKAFSPPKEVQVRIAQLDSESRKILLSLPDIEEDDEGARDYAEYLKERTQELQDTGLRAAQKPTGSFGELLSQSMKKR